jgi:sulfite reductase (ferredoxin)
MELTRTSLPEEIEKEIEVFEEWVERFRSKEIHEEKFKRFRLQHGIYGQRQKGVHMIRVKIPSGGLNPNQLLGLAELADLYSTGKGHVTTRQDMQFHFVKLPDVPKAMRLLAEVGLTTREACGNTVRNVTACHLAGACATELFDVTPHSNAVSRHLLRNPVCQSLPRKFKISFSGCQSSCGLAAIHDIGYIAEKREVDGRLEYGFKVFVGGGLGSHPKLAKLYADFVPMSEILPLSEAILMVFDREGDRKTKSKARMKFVIEKHGLERFKEMVFEALAELKMLGREYPALPPVEARPQLHEPVGSHNGDAADPDFALWRKTNVTPQAQPGYVAAQIKLPLGDITSFQLRALAPTVERYAAGQVRNTREQNMIVHWVRQEDLFGLYQELLAIGLGGAGAEKVVDVVACPGSDTCNLGLTSSMGLGKAVGDHLAQNLGDDYSDLEGIRIRISGCPNSCGQHHIASIGFHGVGKKLHNKLAPHYQLHLGGIVDGNRANVGLAKTKIPAKNIPAATLELLAIYRRERLPGEDFIAYLDRAGRESVSKMLERFTDLPKPGEFPEGYVDYGADTDFNLDDLGPGECAGTMIDALEHNLMTSARAAESARLLLVKEEWEDVLANQNQAILSSARGLLIPFGIDSEVDGDILKEFQHKLVEQGIVTERFEAFTSELGKMAEVKIDGSVLTARQAAIDAFVRECKEAYDRLDANLKLKKREAPPTPAVDAISAALQGGNGEMSEGKKADAILDLKGVACPYNFVRTKLKLEEMDAGQLLEVYLDEGDPIKNVPKSVQNEGHKVLEVAKISEEHYKVLIEKVE